MGELGFGAYATHPGDVIKDEIESRGITQKMLAEQTGIGYTVINEILKADMDKVDIAIELCMYCMRTQVFLDGNKRASVIFANHYMITHGLGLIVIPESHVPEFKKKLVKYYESADIVEIRDFLKENCWRKMK